MSSTSPILGLTIPDDDSPGDPPIHFAAWATVLDGVAVPSFASATDRDTAFTNWVTAGGVMRDGMYSHLQSDGRLWRYNGTGWVWPRWAQGEIGYVSRTSALGPESTANAVVPIPGLALTFTLPSPRKIRITFSGQVTSDAAGGQIATRINNTTTSTVKTFTTGAPVANFGVGVTNVLRQSLAAGTYSVQAEIVRLAVSGNAFLTADLADLLIEDMGGPA